MCDQVYKEPTYEEVQVAKREMEKDSIEDVIEEDISLHMKPILSLQLTARLKQQEGSFGENVYSITDALAKMLIDKNAKYGNSALEPKRIFSKADAVEQILVRIDDKLSRMSNQDEDEDVVEDLLGYLVLLKIAKGK